MLKNQRLPDAEFAIMETVWNMSAPVTIGDVRMQMGDEKTRKMQTLVTLFGRLTERGFLRVAAEKRGREHLFYPVISREEYLRMETESFLDRYHKRSVPSLIAALSGERLSDSDLDELSDFIEKARKRAEK